jgi:hypothetical protein
MHKKFSVNALGKGSHKFVWGYTSITTPMLDLDNCAYRQALHWARTLDKRFNLKGFIIMRSSAKNYHVIFDRRMPWRDVLRVIFSCPLCRRRSRGRLSWAELQAIKGAATLRISNKGRKGPPKIVYRYGSQSHEIKRYFRVRDLFAHPK